MQVKHVVSSRVRSGSTVNEPGSKFLVFCSFLFCFFFHIPLFSGLQKTHKVSPIDKMIRGFSTWCPRGPLGAERWERGLTGGWH